MGLIPSFSDEGSAMNEAPCACVWNLRGNPNPLEDLERGSGTEVHNSGKRSAQISVFGESSKKSAPHPPRPTGRGPQASRQSFRYTASDPGQRTSAPLGAGNNAGGFCIKAHLIERPAEKKKGYYGRLQ